MPRLQNAKVYRSGVTAPIWNYETDTVYIQQRTPDEGSLHLEFELASKGGGTTEVSLRLAPPTFAPAIAVATS
jgi:hypothetical protein